MLAISLKSAFEYLLLLFLFLVVVFFLVSFELVFVFEVSDDTFTELLSTLVPLSAVSSSLTSDLNISPCISTFAVSFADTYEEFAVNGVIASDAASTITAAFLNLIKNNLPNVIIDLNR